MIPWFRIFSCFSQRKVLLGASIKKECCILLMFSGCDPVLLFDAKNEGNDSVGLHEILSHDLL